VAAHAGGERLIRADPRDLDGEETTTKEFLKSTATAVRATD
jgi:hypothetical protein